MPEVTQPVRGKDLIYLISVQDHCALSFTKAETGVRLVHNPDSEPNLNFAPWVPHLAYPSPGWEQEREVPTVPEQPYSSQPNAGISYRKPYNYPPTPAPTTPTKAIPALGFSQSITTRIKVCRRNTCGEGEKENATSGG